MKVLAIIAPDLNALFTVPSRPPMTLLLLEALLALVIFVFIVWWTMFSGRPKGEMRSQESERATDPDSPGKPPADR